MKFWDASAVVPLLVEEVRSAACRRLLRADRMMTVWALTETEATSAVWRLFRERSLDRPQVTTALGSLARLTERWSEVDGLDAVKARAERLLALHPMRAADALQLAAALAWCEDRPKRRQLVAIDAQLVTAAEAEGFDVLVPS